MTLCDYGCGNKALFTFKNGKKCCHNNVAKCSKIKEKSTPRLIQYAEKREECQFCKRKFSKCNYSNHVNTCYLNPINKKLCPICKTPIVNYNKSETCSNKCACLYFKDKYSDCRLDEETSTNYKAICFKYHKKECIICGETNIVSVHHFDNNNKNNDKRNLVPMCPTHHQYMHSRYKYLVEHKVIEYVNSLKF